MSNSLSGPPTLAAVCPFVKDIPDDLRALDVTALGKPVLMVLKRKKDWASMREYLRDQAPGFLPNEVIVKASHEGLADRTQLPGAGSDEAALEGMSVSDRLAHVFESTQNTLFRDLLRAAPPDTTIGALLAAITNGTSVLSDLEKNTALGVPSPVLPALPPLVTSSKILKTLARRQKIAVTYISRVRLAGFIGKFQGSRFMLDHGKPVLELDGQTFPLNDDFTPSSDTAHLIVEYWNNVGGVKLELMDFSPAEERRYLALMGLVYYYAKNGPPRFVSSVLNPDFAASLLYLNRLDDMAELIARQLSATLKRWVPSQAYMTDHVCLIAAACSHAKIDWEGLGFDDAINVTATELDDLLADPEEVAEERRVDVEATSYVARIRKILTLARRNGGAAKDINNAANAHGKMLPDKGAHHLSASVAMVRERISQHRSLVRNAARRREELHKGATYPGVGFGVPNGAKAGLKMAEALARVPPEDQARPQVWAGISSQFHMAPLADPKARFYDIDPATKEQVGVEVIGGNVLDLRTATNEAIQLGGCFYVSDIATSGSFGDPKPLYKQLENMVDAGVAAFVIKLFIMDYGEVRSTLERLFAQFEFIDYSCVTKGHDCEFYIIGGDRRDTPDSFFVNEELSRFASVMAVHALRADVYNQFYTAAVRSGHLGLYAKLPAIDKVIEEVMGSLHDHPWAATVDLSRVAEFYGREVRAGKGVYTPAQEIEFVRLADRAGRRDKRKGKEKVDDTSTSA